MSPKASRRQAVRALSAMALIAALGLRGIIAPCLIDGPINGEVYRAWVEQTIIPTLFPSDVVVMDNFGSHKAQAVRDAIGAADCRQMGSRLCIDVDGRDPRHLQRKRDVGGHEHVPAWRAIPSFWNVHNRAVALAALHQFDTIRAVDPLIWALTWVKFVGLGPFAGILAMVASDIGRFAKLFAEAIVASEE